MMGPIILLSLLIHFGDYYYVGYDFQRRHKGMSSRFSVISDKDMKLWRYLCLYPRTGNKGGIFYVTYDIERLSIIHQVFEIALIAILFLYSSTGAISPLKTFYIVLFGSVAPFTCVLFWVFKLGEKVFALPNNPLMPETEKKKHIRNWLRYFPEERFSCKIQQNQKSGFLWKRTELVLNVFDLKTGEKITSQVILREEKYRYLNERITTIIKKDKFKLEESSLP